MAFIFIQSALPGDLSGAESGLVVRFLTWISGLAGIGEIDTLTASFIIRKAAHFTEYMVLGVCLMQNVLDWYDAGLHDTGSPSIRGPEETSGRYTLKDRHLWALAWIIGTAYAMTDELHQRFVDGRSCETRDMMIDAAGVALGAVIMLIVKRRRVNKEKEIAA